MFIYCCQRFIIKLESKYKAGVTVMTNSEVKEFTFNVESFRKIPHPQGLYLENKKKAAEMIFIIANVKDIPENLPTGTNPREQNMKTKVATKIKEGLLSENLPFFILNRGMLISAKDVKYDNVNSQITIQFEDYDAHGVIDGGHTYRSIKEYRDSMSDGVDQFVKIEILTGIEDVFEDVAAARNTSVQVQDKAIAELKKKFELIKETIKDEPFSKNIAYKENEEKDIDVSDVLTLLFMFNIDRHSNREKMATSAYSSKQTCVKDYTTMYDKFEDDINDNPYYKMRNIMVDIFKLYEIIETTISQKYREATGGRYGSVKGVEVAKAGASFKSKYYDKTLEHNTPKGFIYPIVGAFRALVEEKDGKYYWKADPFEYYEQLGAALVSDTIERSRTLGNNPNAVGKDTNHWKQLYTNVLTQYLLSQLG